MTVAEPEFETFADRLEALTAAEAYEARGDRERVAAMVAALAQNLGVALAIDGRGRKARTRQVVAAALSNVRRIATEHTPLIKVMEAKWKSWMEGYQP